MQTLFNFFFFQYAYSRPHIDETASEHTHEETYVDLVKSSVSNITQILKQALRNLKSSIKHTIDNVRGTTNYKRVSNSEKWRPPKKHVPPAVSPTTSTTKNNTYILSSTSTEPPNLPCGKSYSEIPPHVAEFLANSGEIICKSTQTAKSETLVSSSEIPKISSEESFTAFENTIISSEVPPTTSDETVTLAAGTNESSTPVPIVENISPNNTSLNSSVVNQIPLILEKVNFTSYNDWKTSDFLISFKIAHENYIATSTTGGPSSLNPPNSTVPSG